MAATNTADRKRQRFAQLTVDPLEHRNAPTPIISVGPNINTSFQPNNQAETAIAINPTFTANFITAANDDTLATPGGGHFLSFSVDGGATWTKYYLGSTGTPSLPESAGDPTLAFDRFGNAYAGYLSSTAFGTGIAVVASSNQGASFNNISPIVAAGNNDQPKIATGVDATNASNEAVWVTYRDDSGSISVSGGAVTGFGGFSTMNTPSVISNTLGMNFGDIAVGPNGQVLVTMQDNTGSSGPANLYTSLDADGLGGGAFSNPLSRQIVPTNVGGIRLLPGTSNNFGVDAEVRVAYDNATVSSFNGRAYMAYTTGQTDGNTGVPSQDDYTWIEVRSSDDDGQTWGSPVRVGSVVPGKSQFNPQLAVDPSSGVVGVAWYDTRNSGSANDTIQLFAAFSDDGGATWSEVLVSAGTSQSGLTGPPPTGLRDIGPGDYNRPYFYGGYFMPSWADNSNSTGNNPDGTSKFDIYTARVAINQPPIPPTPPVPPPPTTDPIASNPSIPPTPDAPGFPVPGPAQFLLVGSGAGVRGRIDVLDPTTGQVLRSINPYEDGFTGGVNVASGDVNGDGVADILSVPASHGGADVRVFDGATGAQIAAFLAYDASFDGGASIATADVDGDGINDIITGAGKGGGPNVRVFQGGTFEMIRNFLAYDPTFRNGISVAAGDFYNDGRADIITGPGGDSGADLRLFFDGDPLLGANSSSTPGSLGFGSFLITDPRYRNGVSVAVGDVDGDGLPDLIVAANKGGSTIQVFRDLTKGGIYTTNAYPGSPNGVRVAALDTDGDGIATIYTAPSSDGGSNIRSFNINSLDPVLNVVIDSNQSGATVG